MALLLLLRFMDDKCTRIAQKDISLYYSRGVRLFMTWGIFVDVNSELRVSSQTGK